MCLRNAWMALSHYSEEDKDLWLKPDVDATCEFMEFSSQFFNAMNLQESDAKGLDEETGSKVLKEISTYMRDVAMPSGKFILGQCFAFFTHLAWCINSSGHMLRVRIHTFKIW